MFPGKIVRDIPKRTNHRNTLKKITQTIGR